MLLSAKFQNEHFHSCDYLSKFKNFKLYYLLVCCFVQHCCVGASSDWGFSHGHTSTCNPVLGLHLSWIWWYTPVIPASGCRGRRTGSSRYPSVIQRIRGQPRLLMTLSLKSKQANTHIVLLFYKFSLFLIWFHHNITKKWLSNLKLKEQKSETEQLKQCTVTVG